jgi:hypothetical protein
MGLDWHTFAYLSSEDWENGREPMPEVMATVFMPKGSMYYRGKHAVAILRTFLGEDATKFCFGEEHNDNYFLTEGDIGILITYFNKIKEILDPYDPTDTIGEIHDEEFKAKEDDWNCLDDNDEVEEIAGDVSDILQYLQAAKKGYNGDIKINGKSLYTRVWAWW